jgi:hypothetical protein
MIEKEISMNEPVEPMDLCEEVLFWLNFGYQPEGMIYCVDCNTPHKKNNCQRNG